MREIDPKDVPHNAQIIDVREDFEYAEDHAKGVIHIPMGEIGQRAGEIDPDRDIYVICKSGGRSAKVCEYFEQALGWKATNISGGTDQWRAEGLPMEQGQ